MLAVCGKCEVATKEEKSNVRGTPGVPPAPVLPVAPLGSDQWQRPPEINTPNPVRFEPLQSSDPDDLAKELLGRLAPNKLIRFVDAVFESRPSLTAAFMQKADDALLQNVKDNLGPEIQKKIENALRNVRGSITLEFGSAGAANNVEAFTVQEQSDTQNRTRSASTFNSQMVEEVSGLLPCSKENCNLATMPEIDKAPSVVQFNTPVYYCAEEDGRVVVDVVRLGDSAKISTVKYETKEASALANVKYMETQGLLTFAAGEISKELEITILPDDRWDTTLEFSIHLTDATEATLGQHLFKCRVKILDDDAFPTNKYRETYEKQGLQAIPKMKLFFEYVKMSFEDPGIRRASIRVMILDQGRNGHVLLFLLLKLYLIDVVLSRDRDHPWLFGTDSSIVLVVVGLLILVPQVLISGCMVQKGLLRVGGHCRLKLQSNLLRKFLNYDESLRAAVRISDLMLTMTHHSPDLVEHGYIGFLALVRELGKMVLLLIYQIALAAFADSPDTAITILLPSFGFPICMFVWLRIRHARSDMLRMDMMLQEKHLAHHVEVTAHSARMIIDYSCRAQMMDKMEHEIHQLNDCVNSCKANFVTNMQFAPVLAAIIIGTYVLIAGQQVMNGSVQLGTFLVTIDIYLRVSQSWETVYNHILIMHDALPPLEIIFWHMNLGTDLQKRRAMEKTRRDLGHLERTKIREGWKVAGKQTDLYAVDALPIKLINVEFRYAEPAGLSSELNSTLKSNGPLHTATHAVALIKNFTHKAGHVHLHHRNKKAPVTGVTGASKPVHMQSVATLAGVTMISLEIEQGGLVALVGKRGQGKSTVMRILGSVLLPQRGDIFIPPHLRVYHVDAQPIFFQTNLHQNLCYGVHNDKGEESVENVMMICRSLALSEDIVQHVADGEIHNWDEYLSLTQKWVLHLARAVIANPEVLVIHKPTLTFDDDMALRVLQVFKQFVQHRGIFADGDLRLRRKRTCIITEERIEGIREMDQIIVITATGARQVSADELKSEHLA